MDTTELDPKEDKIKWIVQELKDAKAHVQDWRNEAEENYGFVAGDQWDKETKAANEEKGKVSIVFNRIARVINVVAGLEVQNRQEVRYIPRELSDAPVNEILTGAAKWVRDNTDAEDEESEAFQDTLICGMGWTETHLDYESDPEGQIKIERLDPLDMLWDHKAKKGNLDDARWVARFKKIPRSEFESMWPGKEPSATTVDLDTADEPHDATNAKFYRENQGPNDNVKEITVIEFQWWDREVYYQVLDPQTQQVIEIDAERLKALIEKAPEAEEQLKKVKRTRKVYKRAFINGNEILEEGPSPCKDNFTFRCITGLRDRNENVWFGLVRLMKDPQRYANKWLSQIMYILSVNSKGGLLAETDAFKNLRKAEDEWANPAAITWLNPGALANGKVQQKEMANYPQGLDRLLQYALESINDVPGVNMELMGLADRQQAGYLEAQRKQAGVTILAIFFDRLRRYRKEQGRVLAYFIKEYISDGRLVRILGQDGNPQVIPLIRDDLTYKYDIIVDEAATSPNMKEKVFGILSELTPKLLQMGVVVPPDALDYTPLPTSLVQKWKEQIKQQSENPQPDPKVEAEKAKLQLKQQEFQMTAQMKQQEAELEAQIQAQKVNIESQTALQKLQAEIELARQRTAMELQIQRERVLGELEIKRMVAVEDAKISREVELIRAKNQPQTAQ